MSANNSKIAHNTFFLYGRMVFVLFISIYTTRVILNSLGIIDYGVYNVVCGFVSMFSFFNTTMSSCIQRFYNFEKGKGERGNLTVVFQTSIIIQVALAIIIFIFLELFGLWFVNNELTIPEDRLYAANWIFQFATISLILIILQIPYSSAVIAYERMDFYAFVSMFDAILKLLIVISLPLISGDKLISYGILLVLVSILNFIFYYVYSRNKFKNLRFRFFWDKKLFSSILSYTGWTLLEMFAWMTQNQGINIVMNIFFGPVVNAARAISLQIQNAIQAFCVNLVTAFRPQLIESYVQTNYHRTKTMMYSMSKIMFVFFFMISTPIIIEVNYILNLWLGDSVPEFTSSFIILMLVSMFPRNFVMAFSQIIEASGIVKQYRIWSSILILLVLPSSYLILRCGGTPPSVYYLNLAVCTVLFVTCAFLLKKVFVFSMLDYGKKIIIPCIIVALITIIILKFECSLIQEGLLRFIMVCVSSLICTCFLSYFIIFKSQEKAMMTSMIYKIFLKLGFRNNSK